MKSVLVRVSCVDEYAEIHPDLVVEDFLESKGNGFEFEVQDPGDVVLTKAEAEIVRDVLQKLHPHGYPLDLIKRKLEAK